MKLVKPSFEILDEEQLLSATIEIEVAARTCYKSEEKIEEGSDLSLIKLLKSRGHDAMLEFGPSMTVRFVCDRGVSHELVRHRLCSFAQESTRYCNYSKGKFNNQLTFIIPSWMENYLPDDNAWCSIDDTSEITMLDLIKSEASRNKKEGAEFLWLRAMQQAECNYQHLIEAGWQPQQARAVLPNSLKTEIVVKANLREWRHIFIQRTSSAAHPQMRELMIPLLKRVQELVPVLFDDL